MLPIKYLPPTSSNSETQAFIERLTESLDKAWTRTDGRLTRFCAGYYFVRVGDELIVIDHVDEDMPEGVSPYWIVKEYNGRWYSDPVDSLYECRAIIEQARRIM